MNSLATELERLSRAEGKGVGSATGHKLSARCELTGEVCAVGLERTVMDSRLGVNLRDSQVHVSVCEGCEAAREEGSLGENHVGE